MRTSFGWSRSLAAWLLFVTVAQSSPRVLVPGYRVQLYAEIPTPIALTIDDRGDLLVIESHTHERPEDYEGPAADRIRRLRDADGDGQAEQITDFFQGSRQTMSLLRGADGWIYVATRREIFRLQDRDGDGEADTQETLVQLETSEDYPHNGLAGLAWGPDGRLFFGMGENLGAPYRLVARDGSEVSGHGEGGNLFVCDAIGNKLSRYATGFWNPFGNVFDPHGRLFSVDNDPDASPPCRLLQVVPGGDYGYQFRFGRSGRHPLQAWDGELPGTLPMAAATGEAPCQIVPYEGRLWVTSWGDYRIEAYSVEPTGASCQGKMEVIVQGDASFRPVGLVPSNDGGLFFSDWVDRSYPVHGQGRIWKLMPVDAGSYPIKRYQFPPLSPGEQRAARLRESFDKESLDDADPFIRQAATWGWRLRFDSAPESYQRLDTASQRMAWLQVMRWRNATGLRSVLESALQDSDVSVRMVALRIAAEQNVREVLPRLDALLQDPQLLDGDFGEALLATLDWLEQGEESRDRNRLETRLAEMLRHDSPVVLKRLALRYLPSDHEALSLTRLDQLLEQHPQLADDVIHVLVTTTRVEAAQRLAGIAADSSLPNAIRADAIAGLAAEAERYRDSLEELAQGDNIPLRREAQRSLRQVVPLGADHVEAFLQDIAGSDTLPDGDPAAGRRVFLRSAGARCIVCHEFEGRGGSVGPDLATIHRRATPTWLATAILDPSRDVGPRYQAIAVTMHDGRIWTGLPGPGTGDDGLETLVLEDGTTLQLPLADIELREHLNQSIMPAGIANVLSREELMDLIAFLMAGQTK